MDKYHLCKKHGYSLFYFIKHKNKDYFKCKKCNVEGVNKRRKKIKIMAIELLGSKCKLCNYNKCIGALEFHHLDPSKKDFGISANGETRSWKKIKNELNGCVLLCSNCHKEVHAGIKQI